MIEIRLSVCYNIVNFRKTPVCIFRFCRINKEDDNMTITTNLNDKALEIALEGRLDTMTAPELDAELNKTMNSADTLTLDFSKLDYISSAGLRVLLSAHKVMNTKGGMVIRNVNEIVQEVFEVTGFSDILTIE